MTLRVSVFVDGFNFYYGLFRGQPKCCPPSHKWLDPVKLGKLICRQHGIEGHVVRVHYCSSPSLPGYKDPHQPTRQQHYFRALSGIPEVSITLGQHLENPKWVRLCSSKPSSGAPVKAMVREEKGSDVNLATFLVRDAALDEFDVALVLSNDSDLESAVRIARDDFGKTVVVASPHINGRGGNKARVTNKLRDAASKAVVIDHTLLGKCRLPDPALDAQGRPVSCPKEWN